MLDAYVRARRYAAAMPDIPKRPCPRRVQEGVTDQMRRLADLVIASMLLGITSPLMIIVALMIKAESSGPILDRQTCIGRGGRRFEMLKFRTIVYDPGQTIPVWARKPTQVGQFLRYSRIESLPQLVNVIRGEMSLVDADGGSPSFLD